MSRMSVSRWSSPALPGGLGCWPQAVASLDLWVLSGAEQALLHLPILDRVGAALDAVPHLWQFARPAAWPELTSAMPQTAASGVQESLSWLAPPVSLTALRRPRRLPPARTASASKLALSAFSLKRSWKRLWASTSRCPRFGSLSFRFLTLRSVTAAVGLALVVATAGLAVLWASGRGYLPTPPPPLDRWAASLGVAGAAPLPSDWTLERAAPAAPAPLALTQPLGELPAPLAHPGAVQAWQLYRDGRGPQALQAAENAWKSLSSSAESSRDGADAAAPASTERTRLALLLTQLRWAAGDRPGAIAAARVAVGDPALGIAALRWVTTRADEAGLSTVVLTLASDRDDPALRLLRSRAMRRNGQVQAAQEVLASLAPPTGIALWRRWMLERVRTLQAAGQDEQAIAAARELLRRAGKSTASEELVELVLGPSETVWQKRLATRPQDAPLVLDALIYSAQRRRYDKAIPGLESLAQLKGIDPAVQCHARSWAARCQDRRGAFAKAIPHYVQLAKTCVSAEVAALKFDEDPITAAEIAFRHGRALAIQGKAEGLPLLEAALKRHADSPAALGALDADDAKTLLTVLRSEDGPAVLEKQGVIAAMDYAEKDIIDVAAWRVAQERLVAKRWKDALDLLHRLAEVRDRDDAPVPRQGQITGTDARFDDRDWGRGRADYFAGRALWELGEQAQAKQRWVRVLRRHPLSYYAGMSLAQLTQHGAVDKAWLRAAPTVESGPVIDEHLLGDARVQRARLLGQLGWHDEAGEELDSAGIGRDIGPEQRWAPGDPGKLWSRGALDGEAGRWVTSHLIGRDSLRAFATAYPSDQNREAWKIAYPRGFATLMDKAAVEFGMHPSVLYAICRSESGFNPRIESHAHAIGLLQLILPTAQAMAKGLEVEATPETLRQPAVNVRLGARYLSKLYGRFEREQQMAAGYNAGGGAVGRWRKQRGDWPMDLFVEAIPFRETRDYAKRVTSAIATYRVLFHDEPMYALALTQKAVPGGEEAPTEPPSKSAEAPTVTPGPAPAEAEAVEVAAPAAEAGRQVDRPESPAAVQVASAKSTGGKPVVRAKAASARAVPARPPLAKVKSTVQGKPASQAKPAAQASRKSATAAKGSAQAKGKLATKAKAGGNGARAKGKR